MCHQVEVFWIVTLCKVVVGYQNVSEVQLQLKMEVAWIPETLVSNHNLT
jgi:hypothetical protein